jgi:hypothetical protein
LTPLRVEVDAKPQTPIFAALDKSTYCFWSEDWWMSHSSFPCPGMGRILCQVLRDAIQDV